MTIKERTLLIITCLPAIVLLAACLQPSGARDFIEDDRIQEIIRGERVTLVDRTEGQNLVAENGAIRGLNPLGYYMVEIVHETDGTWGYWFVAPNGMLVQNLRDIGWVSGGRIVGWEYDGALVPLYNAVLTYIVSNARALSGNVYVVDSATSPVFSEPRTIAGVITLPAARASYYLNLSPILGTAVYQVKRIAVSPPEPPTHDQVMFYVSAGMRSLGLPVSDTTEDFVFFAEDSSYDVSDPFSRFSFRVLRVAIDYEPLPGGVNITLVWGAITDHSPSVVADIYFDTASWTIQGTPYAYTTIVLGNLANINPATITWTAGDGTALDAAGLTSFVLDFRFDYGGYYMFSLPGTHFIHIEAADNDGVMWSAIVTIRTLP